MYKFQGERLAELRNDKGLRQKELAKILGVAVRNISLYENNDAIPRDRVKIAIAQYFDVSLDYLMGLSDFPTPYTKDNILFLPKDFPKEAKDELTEYAKYLYQKYAKTNS